MNSESPNVFVVIPSYNEGGRLQKVVQSIVDHGFTNIVVVDDGSTDNSIESVRQYKPVVLRHVINRGAGAATGTGLRYCKSAGADTVVMIDADTQHDAGNISTLLDAHYKENADVSIGNRGMGDGGETPFGIGFYNRIANLVTSVIAGERVYDSQSGFKVFSRKALDSIKLEQDRFEYCSEILIKAHKNNLKVINVPVLVYYPKEIEGKGQGLIVGIKTFLNLLHSFLFKGHRL